MYVPVRPPLGMTFSAGLVLKPTNIQVTTSSSGSGTAATSNATAPPSGVPWYKKFVKVVSEALMPPSAAPPVDTSASASAVAAAAQGMQQDYAKYIDASKQQLMACGMTAAQAGEVLAKGSQAINAKIAMCQAAQKGSAAAQAMAREGGAAQAAQAQRSGWWWWLLGGAVVVGGGTAVYAATRKR